MNAILRPTPLKIGLALLLFVLSAVLWRMYVVSTVTDIAVWGFPLPFSWTWGPCPPGEPCSETNTLFLILDLTFWYLLSGFLVSRLIRKDR